MRRPIFIKDACQILGKAKNTIYTLSRLGQIPNYRQGRKIYFFEDELLDYINNGRTKPAQEVWEDAQRYIHRGIRPR